MSGEQRTLTRRSFGSGVLGTSSLAVPGTASFDPLEPDPVTDWQATVPTGANANLTALSGGLIFASSPDAVHTFSAATGSHRWRYNRPDAVVLPDAISEGTAYVTHAGGFAAVDSDSGVQRWESDVGRFLLATKTRIFAGDETLHAFSPKDGALLWTFDLPETISGMAATPEILYIGSGEAVFAVDPTDGTIRWRYGQPNRKTDNQYVFPIEADPRTSSVLTWNYNERTVLSLRASDGTERWKSVVDTDPAPFPSLLTDRAALVVEDGDLVALDLVDGRQRWRFAPGERLIRALKVVGDVVLVNGEQRAYAVGLEDGQNRWHFDASGEIVDLTGDEDVTLVSASGENEFRVVRLTTDDGILRWSTDVSRRNLTVLTAENAVYVSTGTELRRLSTPAGAIGDVERCVASNRTAVLLATAALIAGAAAGVYRSFS